jgi:hypothetical protein
LNTDLFLFAKTGRPGDTGAGAAFHALFPSPNAGKLPISVGGGLLENLMPDGNVPPTGVLGRTLTELCGDLPSLDPDAEESPEGEATLALEVLEALECEC